MHDLYAMPGHLIRRAQQISGALFAEEVGDQDLHRRAQVGLATVSADAGQVADVLDACERLLAERPEVTLLSTHRQLFSDSDV